MESYSILILNYLFVWLVLTGSILILILLFQPRFILSIATLISPDVVYFTNTNQKIIALTIDDGPDKITTPTILKVLQNYGAKATFFVTTSRIEGNEIIIQDIINAEHELGNHLTEDKPSIQLSPKEFEESLLEAHNVLSQFSNMEPFQWLRPASGWYNRKMINIANQHHYKIALGSIFPFDTFINSSWFAAQHILFKVSPGSIIVLHDTNQWGLNTALTLEKILPELSKRGYKIVTLSELYSI